MRKSILIACLAASVASPALAAPALEPLHPADLKSLAGGADCRATDASGALVFATEGDAFIKWNGKLVHLHEDGIGTRVLHATDSSGIVVTVKPRPGKIVSANDEQTSPKTLTVTGSVSPPRSFLVQETCGD